MRNISGCINISSGFSYSAREIVFMLSEQGYIPNIKYVFEESSYEVRDSLVDNSRLCQAMSIDSSILSPFASSRIFEMVSVM
jgi:predicted Zn-dependent protease